MVRRTIRAITGKIGGLHEAAFWLAVFSFLSQLIAFLRDRLLAHHFGASGVLDVYYASFEVPDLIFATVASLVSASILVPLFAKHDHAKQEGEATLKNFIDSIFTSFFIILIIASVIAWVLMPHIVPMLFKKLGPESVAQTIFLSRILLLSPIFLGLSNFFGSITQYEKRFLLYAISPLLYNIGIVAGLVFGVGKWGIQAGVVGVVIGAFLHMAVQLVWVVTQKEAPKFVWKKINLSEVKRTFTLSIPRTISLSASSIVGSIFVVLASKFSSGSIAVFTLALNLQSVPLSIIGASYSLAAFPTLSLHYVKKEMELLAECLSTGLRHIIFWSLPAAGLFIVLRAHIVRVILGSGAFSWSDTRMTAAVLAVFSVSLVFQAAGLFLTRTHYAFGKTKLPVVINSLTALFTILLALILYYSLSEQSFLILAISKYLKVEGLNRILVLILPLSFSVGAFFSTMFLWKFLPEEVRVPTRLMILQSIKDSIIVSLTVMVTTLGALRVLNNLFNLDTALGVFSQGVLSGVIGIALALGCMFLINNKEFAELRARL